MPGFGGERFSVADPDPILVDARGHRCPTPTLRLRRALETAPLGARVTLLATDPMARIDVPFFAEQSGHALLEVQEAEGAFRFTVEKRASATTG